MPTSEGSVLRPAVVALDVGGTYVKCLTVDETGVLASDSVPTRAADGPEAAFRVVCDAATAALGALPPTHTAAGIGLAVPGTVDEHRGVCVHSENLGWRELPVVERLSAHTGLPVGFGHDVRAGATAERRLGAGLDAGAPVADQLYVSVGTGLAAALVLDGRLVVSGGYAGEIGHGGATTGLPCVCGGHGCAETVASAAAIARRYTAATGTTVDGARDVLARATDGDAVARQVWDDAVAVLGALVADLVRVTGVAHVVVGGGLIHAGDALLTPLRQAVGELLTVHPEPRVVPAALGGAAGSWGAALLGWQAAGVDLDPVLTGYAELLRPGDGPAGAG
ncbi:ROK family protein [Saccharomonospora piscinae]|uniref:ROK family protein n=1 Tax=Saccharomonospora piscinae TaxID=687388 RepID=UPI001107080B|nr:ROK family protein [Saccharomonospora piscinae]TLW94851.1 ROK family protein [Saccharomonospora piscinae]